MWLDLKGRAKGNRSRFLGVDALETNWMSGFDGHFKDFLTPPGNIVPLGNREISEDRSVRRACLQKDRPVTCGAVHRVRDVGFASWEKETRLRAERRTQAAKWI